MLEQYFDLPAVLRRHRDGLLGPYLDSFVTLAGGLGYPRQTVRQQCLVLRALGRFLEQRGLAVADLDEEVLAQFLEAHGDRSLIKSCGGGTSRLVLHHLRELDVAAPPAPPKQESPSELIAARYAIFLRKERGLTQATVINYIPYVRRFLDERFGDGSIRLQKLTPKDTSHFVLRHARDSSPKRAQLMVSALRSFFRFLLARGEIDVDLAANVPTVADWRGSAVPKRLSRDEVEHLLTSSDRTSVIGRRNHAILLLLSRLGFRASEVMTLELDDIDWRAGEITVRGKGGFIDRMPLVHDVGDALATYLRDRPSCQCRRVFIRTRAPIHGLSNPSTISSIVRRALERAGLHPATKGAHLLRYSLAAEMLQQNASMAEIGQVLRHRSPQTTEIYTKIDVSGLRSLAKPWPGVSDA